jgi:hypothetical protein
MKGAIATVAAVLLSLTVYAAETSAPIPKEGKTSGMTVLSGSFQVVPLGKDQVRGTYDVMGVRIGDTADILHNASTRCLGAMTIINGGFDDESGVCISTRLDGDQVFTAHKVTGKVGGEAKGTWKFIGGTGKLAGIQGGGEFTRYSVRRAAEGTSQSVSRLSGTYTLPATTASH